MLKFNSNTHPTPPTPPPTTIMPDRRLSTRRSSVTAPDPFGEHQSNTQSQGHSTITIVKVLPNEPPQPSPGIYQPTPSRAEPSSPTLGSGFAGARRNHRRPNSTSATGSPDAPPPPGRLSFAFSSFAPKNGAGGGGGNRDRESSASPPPSPGGTRHRKSLSLSHTTARLSPEQLYQLGKSAVMQQQQQRPGTPTGSPIRGRAGSPGLFRSGSPGFRDRPASPANTPVQAAGSATAPATFTPLPPHICLPFIERPAEVAALIATHPTCKLLSLISKTLASPPDDDTNPTTDEIPDDPADWTYKHLIEYMTQVDRDTDPDSVWVLCIKSCIRPHSELIWERLKGALGVPPEMELIGHANPQTSTNAKPYFSRPMSESGYDSDVFIDSPYETTSRPSSMRRFSLESNSPEASLILAHPLQSNGNEVAVSISPLLSPRSGPTAGYNLANPPPLSLPATLSPHAHELSGLQEEEEEEEEEEKEGEKEGEDNGKATATKEDDDLYTPAQIQGLRIVTVPSPVSPLPSYPYYATPRVSAISASHSFSSLAAVSPLPPYPSPISTSAQAIDIPNPRSDVTKHDVQAGPNNGLGISVGRSGTFGYATSNASTTSLDSMASNARSPLFPSNFARMGKAKVAAI